MSDRQRLHPVAALEYLVRNLKYIVQAAFPVAVALFSVKMSGYVLVAVAGVVVFFVVYAILHWLRFVYYVEGGELRVEQGVLVRKNTYVPFERIQSVHVSAGIVQQLFGLVKLEVETACGNQKAEISLSALSAVKAEELRMQLGRMEAAPGPETAAEKAASKLSARSLLIAASTTNGLWIMMVGLFAIFSQVDQFIPQVNVYELLGKSVLGLTGSGIVIIIGIMAIFLLVSWVLSIIGSAIQLWNYTISRNGDTITISRGLLERNQYMLPVKRIQAIAIGESILRQPFGLVSIEAVTAGGHEKGSMTSQVFPLMRRDEVDSFLGRFLPEFAVETGVEKVSPAALTGYVAPASCVVLAVALAATLLNAYGYYAFLLLVPTVLWTYMRYRDAGWHLQGDIFIVRQRLLGRTTYLIKSGKIQSMTASRTFLQARRHLASVSVAFPAAYSGGMTAAVAGIPEDRCGSIMDWFVARRGKIISAAPADVPVAYREERSTAT